MVRKPNLEGKISKEVYKKELRQLQIELVKFQRHVIKNDLRILLIFEGRDAAGKDGVIKRITQHLSPRETRVVALGKPSDHNLRSWYFQRYVRHLPSSQEMVIMNRSWYNRAGVEHVMGFCTKDDYEDFMISVVPFENLLVKSGIQILKYYLDISKSVQEKRLAKRLTDPLLQWKTSPVDEAAMRHWNDYSHARNEMFLRTHHSSSPWHIVKADNKRRARLNVIRHILSCVECPDKIEHTTQFDKNVVLTFKSKHWQSGMIAP